MRKIDNFRRYVCCACWCMLFVKVAIYCIPSKCEAKNQMGRFVCFLFFLLYNVQMRNWPEGMRKATDCSYALFVMSNESIRRLCYMCMCVFIFMLYIFINQWLTKQNANLFTGKIRTKFPTVGYARKMRSISVCVLILLFTWCRCCCCCRPCCSLRPHERRFSSKSNVMQ